LLQPVSAFLADPSVSEVLINGPSQVFVEQHGRLVRTSARFASRQELDAALRSIAQLAGRPLDAAHPVLEGHLPDGSRVQAVVPPAAPDGPLVAIRRFPVTRLGLGQLVERRALTAAAAELLGALVAARKNVLVAGGTGSGKTSLVSALCSAVADGERIVVLEDTPELPLVGQHVVRLLTCAGDARGSGCLTIRELFRTALRLRPDRLIVGEIRGGEAVDLIQAMSSGHGGCLSTVHASSPVGTLRRLETLALMGGIELPLPAIRVQIAAAVDVVVLVARTREGRRAVTSISAVTGSDGSGAYTLSTLFDTAPRAGAELAPTAALAAWLPALQRAGSKGAPFAGGAGEVPS
jgi:pilus assembly protein CpaF